MRYAGDETKPTVSRTRIEFRPAHPHADRRVTEPQPNLSVPRRIRWWPAVAICLIVLARIIWARLAPDLYYQQRNLQTLVAVLAGSGALGLWWLFLSRVRWRWRILGVAACLGPLLLMAALFRLRGMSGDLLPILEFRWQGASLPAQVDPHGPPAEVTTNGPWFPQFLGPNRDGVLSGPELETNWTAHPPQILWRLKAGPAWSGFVVAGDYAITQEQRGEQECVVAYELRTGRPLWLHAGPAHFNTTVAGEGPRATPAIASNRVFAFGATGLLVCLDLVTGRALWTQDVLKVSGGKLPDWGFTSAPLVVNDLVMVHGGEDTSRSLFAFRAADGALAWSAGDAEPSYASPQLVELAATPQVLAFNHGLISAHDPVSGATLWSQPWGNGNVVCSSPVVVSSNRVFFSSGYGYGAELFALTNRAGRFSATRLWKSPRLKSKFGHLFLREGCVLGLDDGVLAAVDLVDGSLRWKEGRYGHGQGLLVGNLYLLMAESGELVLLRPTRDAPNELARFRVFKAKTWNPIALAGDLLLVRNDQEAACLRLPRSGATRRSRAEKAAD